MNIFPYVSLVVLVMLSAYFSATETAFSSLSKTKIKTLAESGNKKAEIACELVEKYDKLISTILIGNNIVNLSAASIATVLFVNLYGDMGATLSTAVMTVVVLIFGEISPKSLAKDSPEKFAMFSAPLIRVLIWILTPVNFLFSAWKKLISKLFKVEEKQKMSQEELLMFVDEVQQDGSIDTDEGTLLKNAIEFKEQKAEDILTHRVDLEAVPIDADKGEIAKKFTDTQLSRLLVYDGNIDKIVGVIHLKDFYTEYGITDKPIKDIITEPLFVHKSENISDLLTILQKNKSHIAVVVDEYGGTLGIVTMEDILEELVGEIWDEHDEVVEPFSKIGENVYLVDCSVDYDEFCEFFDIEEESESANLSGWIIEKLDKIPELGDKFDFENLTITVAETDNRRIIKIKVESHEVVKDEEDEE